MYKALARCTYEMFYVLSFQGNNSEIIMNRQCNNENPLYSICFSWHFTILSSLCPVVLGIPPELMSRNIQFSFMNTTQGRPRTRSTSL